MILSPFITLKELLVPKGSFGNGPNSKLTEIVALIIISSLLLLGLYWALIFFFIFLKTGQLTNISTTIAVYSKLEVPSMTICSLPHVSYKDSILEAYYNDRLKVVLIYKHANKNYFSFNPNIRQCHWEIEAMTNYEQCLCIDMWRQKFSSRRRNTTLNPPFFIYQRPTQEGYDADSISIGIKYLKPIKVNDDHNLTSSDDFVVSNTTVSTNQTRESPSISEILKIGIYDQPMIIANQHVESVEPSWFYSNIGNYAQVSLKLLKNYVFDVEKFYFYIIKGYVSRQENEYEITVSQKSGNKKVLKRRYERCRMPYWIRIMNRGHYFNSQIKRCVEKNMDSSQEYEVASFTKFHISFRDFSVTEVFRLSGASVIASFLTLTVVCLSAFNKQLIYELLFPYYEDRNAIYTVTTIATFFSFGYLKKYTED
ncbi:putative signal peptide and transmembrane domain-containing protein [Cryptosporidium canis]|uniref:Signal peptide and transmembrane domain-containing protein n=1 Tax=Cryptosporidium canis TaxID=195482 RepID=A0A9D5DKC4_9CRYT|nr:putative signal peptide and transmembrane domain-containing protein [Cryptosporidium canis]